MVSAPVGSTSRLSKLPPAAVWIAADTVPLLAGADTVTVPLVAPARIWIVAPFVSTTDTGVCAALPRLAV